VEFLDLVTACHSIGAAVGRTVPGLRDRTLSDDEGTIVHENVARVRATLPWIEMAVDKDKTSDVVEQPGAGGWLWCQWGVTASAE
jgi:hypothetical protein